MSSDKKKSSRSQPARAERRGLIRTVSTEVLDQETRRRGLVIDELIGLTDGDGWIIHIPTGRAIPNPVIDGLTVKVEDDLAFISHILQADPEAWEESRKLAFNTSAKGTLRTRLKRAVNSYRGR